MDAFGPGPCIGFQWGRDWFLQSGAWNLVLSLMGRAVSGITFWAICEPSLTLSSLCADGQVVFLSRQLFGLKHSNAGTCRLLYQVRFWCHNGDLQKSSCQVIFPGARILWWYSGHSHKVGTIWYTKSPHKPWYVIKKKKERRKKE